MLFVIPSARFSHCYSELRRTYPETCVNGMSWSHLCALLEPEVEQGPLLAPQVLLLSAELEVYVDNQSIFQFQRARKEVTRHVHFLGAKHELLQEREEIRTRVVREVVEFLNV
jgi:alpha-beta hydrolase superfamily lysophospholipase